MLGFSDESGFLMAPLLRSSQAPQGHTPLLHQAMRHHQKVSVAAALWKTPGRGLVRLHAQTYPNANVTGEAYALFLADLLQQVRGPLTLLHDEGRAHWGEAVQELLDEQPLLQVELLPTYAPELNPTEELWNYLKYDELPNFAPDDVPQLDAILNDKLYALHRRQERLRTFLANSPLKW
jgi:transposase